MRALVMFAVVGALAIAALSVAFMGLIGLEYGDGMSTAVISDLNTIGLIVVSSVASIVSHYIGAAQNSDGGSSGSNSSPSPAPVPAPVAVSVPSGATSGASDPASGGSVI